MHAKYVLSKLHIWVWTLFSLTDHSADLNRIFRPD